jgi:hypothetical protein
VLVVIGIQALLALATHVTKLRSGSDDTDIYFRYATMALEGKVPYREYRVEYPPLALPLFLVPKLIARGVAGFKFAFAAEMLLFNAATVWLVASWVAQRQGLARVRSRLAWYTIYFLLLSRLLMSRYDAAPMFLGFGGFVWWFSGRNRLGGLTSSLGALMKVYPALVPLLASSWELTRPGDAQARGTLVFLLTSLLGAAAWLALGGVRGVSESLGYQLERGFEYGSLYSGAQMLAARILGAEIVLVRDHAAWSSITPWSANLAPLVLPIQLAMILAVWVTFIRRGMTEGVRYSSAAVLAFILTGKVFSPQYLIWLMPFITVLERPVARWGQWIYLMGCAATLLAPGLVNIAPRTSLWVILAYNAKNLIFLWLLSVLIIAPSDEQSKGPPDSA